MQNPQLSMVVLAGGASSRMGKDKSDLLLQGKTFLETQIEKGRLLGIGDILVSGYRGDRCSAPIISDRIPGRGPLGGLEACFQKARYARCLVLGVDVPMTPLSDLKRLIAQAASTSTRAVILQHGEREEPLIGIYHTSLAGEVAEEITLRKGSVFAFLRRIGYETCLTTTPDEYFANVNDPTAYDAMKLRFPD